MRRFGTTLARPGVVEQEPRDEQEEERAAVGRD
jgi:hypothetical protein